MSAFTGADVNLRTFRGSDPQSHLRVLHLLHCDSLKEVSVVCSLGAHVICRLCVVGFAGPVAGSG